MVERSVQKYVVRERKPHNRKWHIKPNPLMIVVGSRCKARGGAARNGRRAAASKQTAENRPVTSDVLRKPPRPRGRISKQYAVCGFRAAPFQNGVLRAGPEDWSWGSRTSSHRCCCNWQGTADPPPRRDGTCSRLNPGRPHHGVVCRYGEEAHRFLHHWKQCGRCWVLSPSHYRYCHHQEGRTKGQIRSYTFVFLYTSLFASRLSKIS